MAKSKRQGSPKGSSRRKSRIGRIAHSAMSAAAADLRHIPFLEALALLKKSGLDVCQTAVAGNEGEALAAARKLGFPVFLKVVSSPVGNAAIHKSKDGLVALAEDDLHLAAQFRMLASAHARLAARGVIERKLLVAVQEEVAGTECIIGAKRDQSFGAVLLFGSGGVLAEELDDVALRLLPVSPDDASEMILETRAFKKLQERGLVAKVSDALCRISELVMKHPEISELDINPLLVSDSGVAAVDTRVVMTKAKKAAEPKWSPPVSGFFTPSSVALIGASRSADSVGQSIMRNLTIGCVHRCEYCRPFLGKIYPVNPFTSEILGVKCYPSILAIQDKVDLAIIALPHDLVLKAVDDCIKKRVRAVIIISAGFGEFNEAGRISQGKILDKLEKARIPMLGPNCLGIIRPAGNLNASFGPSMPPKGPVGFVSQSGALADSIIDWSIQARYGLSALVSYGNKAMLDCYDFFDFFSEDAETKSVALYIEGINNGRLFFEKLSGLARKKPVVILKGGRTSAGVAAAATHTASLAGNAKIFEAAIKQSGAFLANTVEELFDVAKVLAEQPVCRANGIAVVTNGGGCGVLCSDYCEELGVNLPELQKPVLKTFEKSGIMHPAYSKRNPLDIVGDAMPQRYELAISELLKEPYIHGLIVIQTLQAMTNPVMDAKIIVEAHKLFPEKPILSCFMGGRFSRKGMHYLENMLIPDFNDVRKAAVAMKALIGRGQFLKNNQTGAAAGNNAKTAVKKGKR